MESDYLKLSEYYANFLVAVGGVSITVLTLVLSFGSASVEGGSGSEQGKKDSREFLVAALVVATVSCFIGAQMMAETAAFINYSKEALSGQRLFLLASANIFIAIILVLFAMMLLLTTSGKVDTPTIKPIAISVFGFVVVGASIWVTLAAKYRMPAPSGWLVTVPPAAIGLIWGCAISFKRMSTKWVLSLSFIPIVFFMVLLLLYFAMTFDDGGKVHDRDVLLFSLAISSSYASLVGAGIKIIRVVPKENNGNDVLGKPKHEQKKSSEQQVTSESRRRYFVALLFAFIFITSITTLFINYKNRLTGDGNRVSLSSDVIIWITVFTAIVSAIGGSPQMEEEFAFRLKLLILALIEQF